MMLYLFHCLPTTYLRLATSETWCWSGGREILIKRSLCCSIVYDFNGAHRYEQFLQVGRLYWALILPCLARSLSANRLWIFEFFWLPPFLYPLVSWAWWEWPLTWLTNHCPSVLRHCWLCRVTCKIVSALSYNVSSGTLNPAIPNLIS